MLEGVYSSLDNTRVLATRRAGINIHTNINNYNKRLPSNMLLHFEHPTALENFAQTRDEALEYRIMKQSRVFQEKKFFAGSLKEPSVTYPRVY